MLQSCEDLKQLHRKFCFFGGVTKYFIPNFLCLIRICFLSPYTVSFVFLNVFPIIVNLADFSTSLKQFLFCNNIFYSYIQESIER